MKKVLFHSIQLVVILSLLLSLQACGSRSGGSDSTGTTTGTTDTTDTSDTTSDTTATVSAIQLSASSSAIGTNDTTTITATLFDSSGQLVSDSKVLTFSLSAPALGSINSPVTVSSGFTTQTFTARSVEGSVTITATVDSETATKTIQISDAVSAATVAVSSNPASVTIGGTTVVSATVRDSDTNLMPDGTTVNFSVDNSALGTIVSSATTTNGIAQATFSAGSTTTGNATVTATSGSASGSTTIGVTGTSAGSIEFVSATPQIVSIQGSGGQETSEVKFMVKDSNGNPIIGSQEVRLVLSGPNGGEYLGATAGTTALEVGTVDGEATIILHSGTIPGTATIIATVLDSQSQPTNLSTSSGVIAIGGGTPSAGHFSLSADLLNIEGLRVDNVTDDILVLLADRYGNKNVLQGTTVSFYSECGAIDRAVALDDIGQGTVVFRTQSPDPQDVDPDPLDTPLGSGSCGAACDAENTFISDFKTKLNEDITTSGLGNPRDGLCSIIVVVDGEEEFTDADASGSYELGETFVDTYDDIHIDMDDDENNIDPVSAGKPHDPTFEDLVVDRDEDGVFDGLNDSWDSNKRISKTIDLLYTGEPSLTLSTINIDVPNGGKQTIFFALHDGNFNRPIGGTTISAAVSGSGTLSGVKTYTYLDSNALGTPILAVTLSDSDPATDEVKITTLEFTWNWRGDTSVLSVSGITH